MWIITQIKIRKLKDQDSAFSSVLIPAGWVRFILSKVFIRVILDPLSNKSDIFIYISYRYIYLSVHVNQAVDGKSATTALCVADHDVSALFLAGNFMLP